MSFSFDPTGTRTEKADVDKIRAKIGDTNGQINEQLRLEDEWIEGKLATGAGLAVVAVDCLKELLARFARLGDEGLRSAGLSAERKFERMRSLLVMLEAEVDRTGGPSNKPVLVATREAWDADDTLTQPPIRPGFFDADS